jgi:LPXTG-motif cell wall-anchored protein
MEFFKTPQTGNENFSYVIMGAIFLSALVFSKWENAFFRVIARTYGNSARFGLACGVWSEAA